MNSKIINTINNLLEQKGAQFNSGDLFGIISIITLLKIVSLQENNVTSFLPDNSEKKQTTQPGLSEISQLLNSFSGNNENNLQQLLPLLLQTLGNPYKSPEKTPKHNSNTESSPSKTKEQTNINRENESQKKK